MNTMTAREHTEGRPHLRLQWFWAALVIGSIVLTPPLAGGETREALKRSHRIAPADVQAIGRSQREGRPDRTRSLLRIAPRELDQVIRWYARQQRLSPALLRAVIKAESDFNPSAVSPMGAIGLMQLMPRTAASLKIHDPFNPVENIRGGATHLRYLLDRFQGNLPLAIAAYNAGEYRVKRHHYQIPPIQETRDYVEKVLFYYDTFRGTTSSASKVKPMF